MTRTLAYYCRVMDCEHRRKTGEGLMYCKLCKLTGTSPTEAYFDEYYTADGTSEEVIKNFLEKCPNKQIIKQTMAMENL